ncbi:MAG: prolyl oligopeptidase family serine peptidase [Acidobacteria bacterium]|nr:prolyl oligopeptidase family serine peptidase [Acidobacteriota bacterium]
MPHILDRRTFFALGSAGLLRATEEITRPAISEKACPLEAISPVARDGHHGQGFLRKPPGNGPFPAILFIHGGLQTQPAKVLQNLALNEPNPCRFLAAGYVVAPITYRSRNHDPQSRVSLEDCLAAVEHLRGLPFVHKDGVIVYGCSGGGDLALEVAAATTSVRAIVPEEPASLILTGIFHARFPKKGEFLTPADSAPISENPKKYYTPEYQEITRAKLRKIRCPILIIQGDVHAINHFNAEVLIPELKSAGKTLEVKTYPGAPHCFAFAGNRRPAQALQVFQDTDAFCRRYLPVQPKSIDRSLVQETPVAAASLIGSCGCDPPWRV